MADTKQGLKHPFDQAATLHENVRVQCHAGLERLGPAVGRNGLTVQRHLHAVDRLARLLADQAPTSVGDSALREMSAT